MSLSGGLDARTILAEHGVKVPSTGRRYPAVVSMGIGHAGKHEEWPGTVSERYISENNQRGFYNRWEEFMNADSWKDIHVDPITVNFEGTAGFNT